MTTATGDRALEPPLRALLLRGWLVLAVVDGISAAILSRVRSATATPITTFQGVAVALLGRQSMQLGWTSFLLGVAMHVFVAFVWVAIYTLAYRTLPALRALTRSWMGVAIVGAPLGAFIWFFMNLAVFPLTRIGGHAPITSSFFLMHLAHHTLVVGPLIVAMARARR